ncbi:hypothetical protein ACHAXT_003253 [Thalassiosira profunda]
MSTISAMVASRAVCSFVGRGSASIVGPQMRAARQQRGAPLHVSYATSSSTSGRGFGKDADKSAKDKWKVVDVPLVFVPGMKGTHLAFENDATSQMATDKQSTRKKRAWLTLGNLLNFPPRPDNDKARDLSLPLTYDYTPPAKGEEGHEFSSHYPRQHRGDLVPDGIVDHIIELNVGSKNATNYVDLNFLPFYGHVTRMLREIDIEYHARRHDGKVESTESFLGQDDEAAEEASEKGIVDRAGSFVERASNWAFRNETAKEQQSHHSLRHCRPTAVFAYDWRRPLPELCTALHQFCEDTFPGQPVQILAHSLGGLMTFAAMRENPEKYRPGCTVVGVPFETGIQYLQDLHKGYYTELDRCRQFTPDKQFSMSSHWSFFPITKDRCEDRFVDVSERSDLDESQFSWDKSGIGKEAKFQPKIDGRNAYFDFYDVEEWERLDIGIFGPEYDDLLTDEQRDAYKEHMRIQMAAAKKWRKDVLGEGEGQSVLGEGYNFPPLVAMASDAVPTVNQIIRRRKQTAAQNSVTRKGRSPLNPWSYDYVSGRSVPGDGRIDFDKAFPPGFVEHKRIALDSKHASQMCWEESGGSLGTIYPLRQWNAATGSSARIIHSYASTATAQKTPKGSSTTTQRRLQSQPSLTRTSVATTNGTSSSKKSDPLLPRWAWFSLVVVFNASRFVKKKKREEIEEEDWFMKSGLDSQLQYMGVRKYEEDFLSVDGSMYGSMSQWSGDECDKFDMC